MNFSRNAFASLLLFCAPALLLNACDDNSIGPDFSAAPPPFDRSEAISDTTIEGGTQIFVLEEGAGLFNVISRDQIQVRYTGRTAEGEIFFTSYRQDSPTGNTAILRNLTPVQSGNTRPLVEGLRKGLLGMKEGEKRIIEVPPSMGYNETYVRKTGQVGQNGVTLTDKTLIYDVELVTIFE